MEYKIANDLGLDKQKHKEHGQDFTPRELAIKMAKKLEWKDGPIIDPCVGSGNLLKACLEVYSKLKTTDLYGVDIDPECIEICLNDSELEGGHFQVGNVLEDDITNDDFWKKPPLMLWKDYKKTLGFKYNFGKLK